jgi:tetratricopeptide (TPR) repeat protein
MYYSAKVKAELALMGVPGHSISDAVTLLRRFQETGKSHYQYHRGLLLFGQLAFSADRLPLAIETFQNLTAVGDQNLALRASVELGNSLLLEKRPTEARQAFQRAMSFDLTDPDSLRWKQTARILGHVAEADSTGVAAATAAIQAIIAAESPDDVHINAVGYNALGRLQFQANQTRDAELSYLHTELLFAAHAQAHPEALYFLSKIWADSGKTDRATEAREKLKGRYGGTYWAAKLTN